MERSILHCDLNCFYASVELLTLPQLRRLPVAVCGDPESRHGIVLAKNEIAKSYGVKTAETIYQARRKCPELICIPPHHRRYADYSKLVNEIYLRYTDLVEPFGIDESWLDITGSKHLFGGDAAAIANEIRARVKRELGLTLSVGVSFNKIFAKLGSDYKKPDATTVISRESWKEMVWPLPAGDMLYVGDAARKLLGQYGVRTIGQLAACPRSMLEDLMGKLGGQLHNYANGLDREPVRSRHEPETVKSVGNGSTFPKNLTTRAQVTAGIALLADSVASRLRRAGLYAGGVHVTVRDPAFRDRSRQRQLSAPTHLIRDISAAALALTEELWQPPSPIRALTVTAIYLTPESETYEQTNLFAAGEGRERQERLEAAMDGIRRKYGGGAIAFGTAKPEDSGGGSFQK